MMEINDLKRLVFYDKDTGKLFWKEAWPSLFVGRSSKDPETICAMWNTTHSNKPAFDTDFGNGYRAGTMLGKNHKAHRVAWAIHHGEWPNGEIDHVNHIRSDNRIVNLRHVDKATNQQNASMRSDNSSGKTGVSWCKRDNAWVVQISFNGNRARKNFKSYDEAVSYRLKTQSELGFHQNHGSLPSKPRNSDHSKNRNDDHSSPF